VLVDARPLAEFAAGHPKGALSNVLRPVFGSWLGWLVELDRALVFVLGDGQDRAELVRQCLTIGHENLLGELDGGMKAWQEAGYPVEAIPLVDPVAMVGWPWFPTRPPDKGQYSLMSCSRRMSASPQCCASSRSTWRYTQRSGSGPRRLP
jgi:rhodanese-related sulfurtransferase